MTTLEQQAQELIKQQLSRKAPSYTELLQLDHTGFMDCYLEYSRNDRTMSTTADCDVTIKLARIDQLREYKEI